MNEDSPSLIRKLEIPRLAAHAHRLCRCGQISGPSALALIVWPDQRDMRRYLERVSPERSQQRAA